MHTVISNKKYKPRSGIGLAKSRENNHQVINVAPLIQILRKHTPPPKALYLSGSPIWTEKGGFDHSFSVYRSGQN
jgi:hypothetical protein